jgi:hypothetical protein
LLREFFDDPTRSVEAAIGERASYARVDAMAFMLHCEGPAFFITAEPAISC